MRVAREVGQHLLGPREWALGVDVPLGVVERFQPRLERSLVGEPGVLAEELQAAGVQAQLGSAKTCAAFNIANILPRNIRDSTGTGSRSSYELLIQRVPSVEMPPPGVISKTCFQHGMCTCG